MIKYRNRAADKNVCSKFQSENLKEKDQMENWGLDGRIMLGAWVDKAR
jgi:hypothetical protein